MNSINPHSITMAQRLRLLRQEKELSHDGLSKALKEKYRIDISRDSLMNYEVCDINHAKFLKNIGMRIEYLYCLSDFYGVSSDYILGFSDIRSVNPNLHTACDYTGLSETSVSLLHHFKQLRYAQSITQDVSAERERILERAKEYSNYLLKHLPEDEESYRMYSRALQADDIESIAAISSQNLFNEEFDIALKDMMIDKSLSFRALEILINNEEKHKILKNIALFLIAKTSDNDSVSFVASCDHSQEGTFYKVGAEFITNGLLSAVDASLHELRKGTEKEYTLCDFEGHKE